MVRPFLHEVGRDPGRLRIALTVTPWIEGPVDPECAEAARAAARLCASLGHHIEAAPPQAGQPGSPPAAPPLPPAAEPPPRRAPGPAQVRGGSGRPPPRHRAHPP